MTKDFREYLVESSRHDQFGRFFKEIAVGVKLVVSFQASETHGCNPQKTLDDIYAYDRWEVAIRQVKPAIDVPKVGAWNYLKHYYWAKPFDVPEFQRSVMGENIPVKHCQQILEDLIEFAMIKNQLDSEDDIRLVEPDENLKRGSGSGCGGGCGSGKGKTIQRT